MKNHFELPPAGLPSANEHGENHINHTNKAGWADYLKTTGNPMLKLFQAEAELELRQAKSEDTTEIERIRSEINEIRKMGMVASVGIIQDMELANEVGLDRLINDRKTSDEKLIDFEHRYPRSENEKFKFRVDNFVKAPEVDSSNVLVYDWKIIKAGSGHYLLERENKETKRFYQKICSEQDLVSWGNN